MLVYTQPSLAMYMVLAATAADGARDATGDRAGGATAATTAAAGWWGLHDAGDVSAGWISRQAHADHGQRPADDCPNPTGRTAQSALHNPSTGASLPWLHAATPK
jgi:hypothetical protein